MTFSSITFVDDAAMRNPGDHFEYAIREYRRRKRQRCCFGFCAFKTPWLGNVAGVVEVGTPNLLRTLAAQLLRKRSKQYSVSEVIKAVKTKISPRTCMCGTRSSKHRKRSAAYRMTDQLFEARGYGKRRVRKNYSEQIPSIQKVTVCTLETTASLDIRVPISTIQMISVIALKVYPSTTRRL